jgi:hypothetical protein
MMHPLPTNQEWALEWLAGVALAKKKGQLLRSNLRARDGVYCCGGLSSHYRSNDCNKESSASGRSCVAENLKMGPPRLLFR